MMKLLPNREQVSVKFLFLDGENPSGKAEQQSENDRQDEKDQACKEFVYERRDLKGVIPLCDDIEEILDEDEDEVGDSK